MKFIKEYKSSFSNSPKYSNFGLINPATGALAGATLGGIKGGLEQDPYQELSPSDRAFRVLGNAAIGAGVGGSLGALPSVLSHNPTANKVAGVVAKDTGINVLPIPNAVAKVKGDAATLEQNVDNLLQSQKVLDDRRYIRKTNRTVRREQARLKNEALVEDMTQRFVEPAVEFIDKVKPMIVPTVKPIPGLVVGAAKGTVQAGRGARKIYDKGANVYRAARDTIKENPPSFSNGSYMADFQFDVNRGLAIGALAGTGIGGLYGATKAFTDNQHQDDRRLLNLQSIQDPYLRIRQQELYDSMPSKVGRVAGDTTNGVGNTALNAGLGAAVGGAAVGGALLGVNTLTAPKGLLKNRGGNRFAQAFNTLIR
jgi:hypothetical protein